MKKVFYLFLIVMVTCLLYARYMGINGLEVKEYFIASEKIPSGFDGLKIVHFSDTLIDSNTSLDTINEYSNKINELNPDIVVFTGDLLKEKSSNKEDITNIFKNIKPSLNKFYITGDEDNDDSLYILDNADFINLNSTCNYIYYKDLSPILMCGNNSYENNTYVDDYSYLINLIHKPDDYSSSSADLTLAGHSLGGLIRLPYIGGIVNKDDAKIYTDEKYNHDGKILFVSFGIGTDNIPLRFLNKPSINLYRLKK